MLDPLPGRLMQRLLLAVQGLHLPLQPLHPGDHAVQRGDRLGSVLAGEGGVGGGLEGGEDVLVLPFDVLLDGLEVFPGDFVRETQEGLVLFDCMSFSWLSDPERVE